MALILSRRENERIMIGDNIVLQVVEITPTSIRLGITAPKEMCILREELFEKERMTKERKG